MWTLSWILKDELSLRGVVPPEACLEDQAVSAKVLC